MILQSYKETYFCNHYTMKLTEIFIRISFWITGLYFIFYSYFRLITLFLKTWFERIYLKSKTWDEWNLTLF